MNGGIGLALSFHQTLWRKDHARLYALGKLVCLAVGVSCAGHRHPHLGLGARTTDRASAKAALIPPLPRRRTQTCSLRAASASRPGHRITHSTSPFAAGIHRIQDRRLSGHCAARPSQILTILHPLVTFRPRPSGFTSSASWPNCRMKEPHMIHRCRKGLAHPGGATGAQSLQCVTPVRAGPQT